MPVYCAMFMGQGGTFGTSIGVTEMCNQARAAGIIVDEFVGTDIKNALPAVQAYKKSGHKITAAGYSEGVGAVGYISQVVPIDLAIGIDPSRDCVNYRIRPNTPRSILWHNQNWLSRLTGIGGAGEASDPGGDLGFKEKHEINENHLLVDLDKTIQAAVLAALKQLDQEK